jgi:hypothetical protein
VARRHQLLLGGVDLLLEPARLAGRGLGRRQRRRRLGTPRGEQRFDLLLARRDLLDLSARREQALDDAAALHHRAAQRLALERHDRDVLARAELERVLERRDHDRVGQRLLDPLGVGPAHAVEVRQHAERLRLPRGDRVERAVVGARPGRGERQEGAAAGALRLQPADPAQRLRGVGHDHGLEAVAEEGLDRALVLGVRLDGVRHDAGDRKVAGPGEQRAHAFVERRVGGDDLLERRAPSG